MSAFTRYPNVFKPIKVGPVTLRNRIQFSPMVSAHADAETGACTDALIEWVGSQAKNGVGIITIGSSPIDYDRGRDFYGCLSIWKDSDEAHLKMLSEQAHKYGAKISVEMTHAGCIGDPRLLNGKPAFVPSVIPQIHDGMNVKEIEEYEMYELIRHWTACAKRCSDAGFDMVMLHGAHGNLLSSFLSPLLNTRTDEYGGSAENRWRFPQKLMEAVREAVGDKTAVELRISGDERVAGRTSLEERIAFLKQAQKHVDMVIVSTGIFTEQHALSMMIPSYYLGNMLNVDWASEIKQNLDIPVSVVGGITTIDEAESIISSGKADIVAMARPLIADQKLVEKARVGREEDIRACLRCNQCLTYTCLGAPIRCTVNPTAGMELKYNQIPLAVKKKKVLVAGGGPAGMTAAQYLIKRGHDVTLYEASDKLGGRLHEASALWCKTGFRRYLDWTVKETKNCGARLVLSTVVTPELIKQEAPDAVVVAVGASELIPAIPGIDGANVVRVTEIDKGIKGAGEQVVICGGGLSGTECGVGLAREGKSVILVDQLPEQQLCNELFMNNRLNLFELIQEYGIKRVCGAVKSIGANGVELLSENGGTEALPADTVIIAFGLAANHEQIDALMNVVPESYLIGDCNRPGIIFDANHSAFTAAMEI